MQKLVKFFGVFLENLKNQKDILKLSDLYVGASTIILSKDIDKYAFMCGSNFYESDVMTKISNL